LLDTTDNFYVINTSPAIASDGTIYVGVNQVSSTDGITPIQGYLFAYNPDGTIRPTKIYIRTLKGADINFVGNSLKDYKPQVRFVIFNGINIYDSNGNDSGNYYLYSINAQSGSVTLIQNIPFNNGISLNNSMCRDNNDNLYFSIVTLIRPTKIYIRTLKGADINFVGNSLKDYKPQVRFVIFNGIK